MPKLRWTVEFDPAAAKELKKLGKEPARRVIDMLENRVAKLNDPRELGKPLLGEWSGYWRWRFGNYRVIARIEHERVVIFVVRVAHRREVY